MIEKETTKKHWFVMSAVYGQELKIKKELEELQIECFVPMKTSFSKEKGKVIKTTTPAIKNLIFIHDNKETIQLFKIQHKYLQYQVNRKKEAIIVPEKEMQNFIRALNINDKKIVFHDQEIITLERGESVKIVGGEFDGIEGEFVRLSGKRNRSFLVKINGVIQIELKGVALKMIERYKHLNE